MAGRQEEPADPPPTSVGWEHPGLPGSGLDADLVAQLPPSTPGPPWETRIEAVLWIHRSCAEARATLPAGLRARFLGPTIAGLVHYTSSPVGSYHEVLASPVLVRGGLWRLHLPFIAVDSLASLHAGRVHWALPKTLASFTGSPAPGSSITARGDGWNVRAAIAARGPVLPTWLRISLAQRWPDGSLGSFPVTFRGRLQAGRVRVEVSGEVPVAGWLRSGHHLAVCLSDARMTLPHPRAP